MWISEWFSRPTAGMTSIQLGAPVDVYNLSRDRYIGVLTIAGDWWEGRTWPSSALLPALRPRAGLRFHSMHPYCGRSHPANWLAAWWIDPTVTESNRQLDRE